MLGSTVVWPPTSATGSRVERQHSPSSTQVCVCFQLRLWVDLFISPSSFSTSPAHTVCLLSNCTGFNCENKCTTKTFFCLCVGSGPKPRQRPRIIAGPQNMTASLHYTVVLECVATGNPSPIISWSRADSKPIDVFNARVLGRWEDAWCTTVPIMLCATSAITFKDPLL